MIALVGSSQLLYRFERHYKMEFKNIMMKSYGINIMMKSIWVKYNDEIKWDKYNDEINNLRAAVYRARLRDLCTAFTGYRYLTLYKRMNETYLGGGGALSKLIL